MIRQLQIPGVGGLLPGVIVDLFAGGGGASLGIELATGRSPDYAVNHSPLAIACHEANHPSTEHFTTDVFDVDPEAVCQGRPCSLLWASPDCTYHSRAKGGQPIREEGRRMRSLPWVVIRWAAAVAPGLIFMENVPELVQWGPVRRGKPVRSKRGKHWREFLAQLRALGYAVEHRTLPAHHYGTGTSRERLYLIARRDGYPICWPDPVTGADTSAASSIDWSLPCPSIFLSREEAKVWRCKRPLADATCRRIARGVVRFVLQDPQPFVISIDHQGNRTGAVQGLGDPLTTITHKARHALIAPWLMKYYGGVTGIRCDQPVDTITETDHHAVVAPFLAPLRGTSASHRSAHRVSAPLSTISAGGTHHGLVAAFLMKYYKSGGQHQRLDEPMHTIVGTDRHALVTVPLNGETYAIADIGMRMLQPHELARAQGFPSDYHLPRVKKHATAMIGNSVCPPVAKSLVAANLVREAVAA